MLQTNHLQALEGYYKLIKEPVELCFVADPQRPDVSAQMRDFLNQARLDHPLIKLTESVDSKQLIDASLLPAFTVKKANGGSGRIQMSIIPMGHEFTTFVLALLHMGGHTIKQESTLVEALKSAKIEKKAYQTIVSLSCHNCPDVAQAFNTMAALNENIDSVIVDGALFESYVVSKNVLAVPSTFEYGISEPISNGLVSFAGLVQLVLGASSKKIPTAYEKRWDQIIVGTGPSGLAASVYTARKGLSVLAIGARIGGQLQDTMGVENYIGQSYTTGPALAADMLAHNKSYEVPILEGFEVVQIDKKEGIFYLTLDNQQVIEARSVIVATGASWRKLGVPGEKEFSGKGVAYCPHCDGPLFKGKPVAVIGGGNSGVEAALDLAGIVEHVYLLEYADSLKADAVLVNKARLNEKITIITNAQTLRVEGEKAMEQLVYQNTKSKEQMVLKVAGAFVQIGLVPNTKFMKGLVQMSPYGEIVIDAKNQTSVPGLFASGDCTTVPYKQIVVAAGEGSKASLGAFEYLMMH